LKISIKFLILQLQNNLNQTKMSKHLRIVTALAVLIFSASCGSETASETDSLNRGSFFSDYKPADFGIPKQLSYLSESEVVLFDKFYPVGISASGNFAYVCEPADEATGYYFMQLQFAQTNEEITVFKIDETDALENTELSEIWLKNKSIFNENLNKEKIVPLTNLKFEKLPARNPNFDARADISYASSKSGLGIQVVQKATIMLAHKESEKQLRVLKFNDEMTVNVKIHGYIKLQDNFYALIVTDERIGYEGPPNVHTLHVVPFTL